MLWPKASSEVDSVPTVARLIVFPSSIQLQIASGYAFFFIKDWHVIRLSVYSNINVVERLWNKLVHFSLLCYTVAAKKKFFLY